MKTIQALLVLLILSSSPLSLFAQEDPDTSYWNYQGKIGISFSQVGLSNWAAGGDPSVSFNGLLNASLKYEKSPHLWQTTLDAGYGMQRIGTSDESFKKTDDNIVLLTRYGYQISKKWYASALASFRTQFYEGFTYDTDPPTFISDFLAPAYAKAGIGVSYNHKFSENESFTFTFTPINGLLTIVANDSLSARGQFGVDPGSKTRFRGGMDLMLGFNREVVKNVSLKTTMTLFSPYSDMATMVVNWDLALWFTINKFLTANIHTQLLYDQDVNFINDAGETYNSALQFKEVLGLGLTYSF